MRLRDVRGDTETLYQPSRRDEGMTLSVFDLFKIGIGPSSSHTVGPMVAAKRFVAELCARGKLDDVNRVLAVMYGSLALTGKGHATDNAVILGLHGETPELVELSMIDPFLEDVRQSSRLELDGGREIAFHEPSDLVFKQHESLPRHPNGMRFTAFASDGTELFTQSSYSLGGGFVVNEDEAARGESGIGGVEVAIPYPFRTARELLCRVQDASRPIAELVYANERAVRSDEEIRGRLDAIWAAMEAAIERGCRTEGTLPGGLLVRRRAPVLYRSLEKHAAGVVQDPLAQMDWVSLFALAVNEENAAGGRIVTAPTNGASGVIPAVLAYYRRFIPGATVEGGRTFLLTAAAVGMLYKWNASLSAAEMGCQGEVGVACSMAAAGLAAVMGGTPQQIENAAEIGMEHHLGLTCDPVRGLVQIPCIERNTMGAVKAINAARLAVLYGDGTHQISLDRVIETMRQTGLDMQNKYKETSLGGLAVNAVDC